jgi:hypothetical protein
MILISMTPCTANVLLGTLRSRLSWRYLCRCRAAETEKNTWFSINTNLIQVLGLQPPLVRALVDLDTLHRLFSHLIMGSLRVVASLLPLLATLIEAGTSLRQHQKHLSSSNFDPSLGASHQATDRHERDSQLLDKNLADEESRLLTRDQYNTLTDLEKK